MPSYNPVTGRMELTRRDIEALSRLTQSETPLAGMGMPGVGMVVDSVLNRAAAPAYSVYGTVPSTPYGETTIQSVINKPQQYSGINPFGSWTGCPRRLRTIRPPLKHTLA
jgi:hypothetical protein